MSYWKGLVTQAELFAKTCKICQQFLKRRFFYGNLPFKNIAELKLWDSVHIDLIVTYSKSIRKHQKGGNIICKNVSLSCMITIDPATVWFEIFDIPMFDLKEAAIGNDEYTDKSSARVIHLFNNKWI